MTLDAFITSARMWLIEMVAKSAEKDAEREVQEFLRELDRPPAGYVVQKPGGPAVRPGFSDEEEMALFDRARNTMKGG